MPHVTLRSIAQNERIDVIFEAHAAAVSAALSELNGAMKRVEEKHIDWKEYEVPLELTNEEAGVVDAHKAFFAQLEKRTAAVDACVMQASGEVDLLDQPKIIRRCVRVSGPFSVEGVRPEELVLGEDGRVFDATVNEDDGASDANISTYIDRMINLLKMDGVTFLGNRPMKFSLLERAQTAGLHAVGEYVGAEQGEMPIAAAFGPQYGPVNAIMTSQAIEAARGQPGIKELIIAGFSFDAAAQQKAREASESGLQVNIAHIRPDVSPGMEGLLKDQRNSQLFTVFGQPEFKAKSVGAGEYQVELGGVCVYNPLTGMVESSNASKVAAWFLDADYDGQCFCVSQAFFPDSKAWEKIAKALGSKEDEAAFEAFAGTTSLPFKLGQHRRVAIKVIDPRGNEVMGIKTIA
jgi:adenine-specific DNA-methyltransferase